MKNLFLLFACISILSCSPQKTVPAQGSVATSDTVENVNAGSNETKAATPTKSIILNNTDSDDEKVVAKKPSPPKGSPSQGEPLSACIQKLIKQFKEEDVQNPPRKIYSYKYNGNLVYYVTPPCCDFFSDLYDSDCKIIAHPDGGITGKGDGRAKDFIQNRSQEKLVWEDVRRKK